MPRIAPEIFRKRLLVEGYFCTDFEEAKATELTREFFRLSEYETASF